MTEGRGFLLDTNVLSELRKAASGRADANVLRWSVEQPDHSLFVSVVSIFEIEHGILLLERRDAMQAAILRRYLERQVLPEFEDRLLPIDVTVMRRAARLHVPDPAPFADAIIAATALVHDLEVVTRNTKDFSRLGVRLIDPWRN